MNTMDIMSMTREEKLEEARKLYKTANADQRYVLERLFPELIEEKNEKIKHEIKVILANTDLSRFALEYTFADMLNWLEKQGNIEQTLANEVKPKFKVGDWVVNKFGEVWYIDSFDNKHYKVSDRIGNYKYFHYIPISKQDEMRLWTIQDAKDCDILVTENKNIFIFKSIDSYTVYDYCGLYFEKFLNYSGAVNGKIAKHLPIDYVPATKEQRITLFKAMHEKGYEWDTEKKELKKIIPL